MMGWIAVDLDGTLAHYDTWRGIDHIGAPIPEMINRVKTWLFDGRDVRIFTARVSVPADSPEFRIIHRHITEWLEEHLGRALPITNVKDFGMDELWDDRAVQVEKNTGRPIGASTRGLT